MHEPIELTDMKQRVALAESCLKEAKYNGGIQGKRLSHLLRTIEAKFAHFQGEIEGLRADQTRAIRENRQLRHTMAFLLSEAREAAARGRGVPSGDLDDWIGVLSETTSSAHGTLDGTGSKTQGRTFMALKLDERDRRTRKKGARKQRPRSGGKRLSKALALVAVLGWLVAAAFVADKYHASVTSDALNEALIRSHSERHTLSQKLEHVSAELETVKANLSKYQSREIRAAGDP